MNVSGHKSETESIKNNQNKAEKQLNASGFNLSDFGDVKNSKSNSFTANNFFEQKNKLPENKPASK